MMEPGEMEPPANAQMGMAPHAPWALPGLASELAYSGDTRIDWTPRSALSSPVPSEAEFAAAALVGAQVMAASHERKRSVASGSTPLDRSRRLRSAQAVEDPGAVRFDSNLGHWMDAASEQPMAFDSADAHSSGHPPRIDWGCTRKTA
jgi:hypothetical protein